MRLLFVSSTTVGGSGRSQRELARHLVELGHHLTFLVDDESSARARRWSYEQLSDLSVRLGHRVGGRVVGRFERWPGRRTGRSTIEGLEHLTSPVPQNALSRLLDAVEPDVVVGNSLVRLPWRRIRATCARRNIPTVLYVRETASLDHLLPGELPDAVVANARSLADAVEKRGVACTFVPSVIDLAATRVASTRQVALVVNPIPSHGIELVWDLAERLIDVPFVLQESWPLDRHDVTQINRRASHLPNVTLRRVRAPGPELYRDARVLLAPHRIDNRPRVIAEAQANGIPVIAATTVGLAEAVGDGGLTIDADDTGRWCDEIRSLWTDAERYADLSQRSILHSQRPENDPAAAAAAFEEVLALVRARANRKVS